MQAPKINEMGKTGQPDALPNTLPNRTCLRRSSADCGESHTANYWDCQGGSQNRAEESGLQYASFREMYAFYGISAPELGDEG